MSDAASGRGQRLHFGLLRLELVFVIVGAFLGVVDSNVSRVTAAMSFIVAIVMRGLRIHTNPVADWHNGRAAAESLKTMCWRYAVCAAPFSRELPDDEADVVFSTRLQQVVQGFNELHIPPSTSGNAAGQITEWMRATRALPLDQRKSSYKVHRIDDQYRWYGGRADRAARSGTRGAWRCWRWRSSGWASPC